MNLESSILFFLLSLFTLTNCTSKYIKYPYAENNTTKTVVFDKIINDDYQWMELNTPQNEQFYSWISSQDNIQKKYFKKTKAEFSERISELSRIPDPQMIETDGNVIYYLKTNMLSNEVTLYKYIISRDQTIYLKSFDKEVMPDRDMKAALSEDKRKIAIVSHNLNNSFNLLVFDLEKENNNLIFKIENVTKYNPVWHNDNLICIEQYNERKKYTGQQVVAYTFSDDSTNRKIIYENKNNDMFNIIDISVNRPDTCLYISDYANYSKKEYVTTKVNLNNLLQSEVINRIPTSASSNMRMAGNDNNNIYYIQHEAHLKGNIYALNKRDGNFRMVLNSSGKPFRNFNIIKDHFIVSFHEMTQTLSYLVDNNTFKYKKIETKEKGHCNFVNNKHNTTILFTLESIKYPKSLFATNAKNPDISKEICHLNELDEIRYNPDEIQIEEHSIFSCDGRKVNFVVSYKGVLNKDGKNPLMILASPINAGTTNSQFDFWRILYLEKGFILVERSPCDLDLNPALEHKMIDIEDAIAYLIEKRYTSNNKIVINTYNYGATVVASILNKKPDICRAVIFTNGIFDMVRHQYLEPANPYLNSHFKYKNDQEFKRVYNLSAYHHIRNKENYPSIFLGFNGYQNNNPAHSFKYAAKLQMRTKAKNPIIIYNPIPDSCHTSYKIKDLKQYIYHSSLFVFDQLGIN